MTVSRTKFVIIFIMCAFAFLFVSNTLFGTGMHVFPPPPQPWLDTAAPVAWRSVGYEILLPIKVVLVGPMLATGNFLREDPPPPFVAVVFALYWTLLSLLIYYLISKVSARRARAPA